ncbi:MAG: ABC transporter substrate-binding protein [Fusobacteriaceae bacterium]
MRKYFFIFSVSMLFIFISCGEKKDSIKTVTVINNSPKSLDPYAGNEIPGLFVDRQIYNSLFEINSNGEIIPRLVEKYEYISPKEIRISLIKNIKFHNGSELKASDVVFSLKRMQDKPASSVMVADISEAKVLDDYTFKIILKKPSASILFSLSHPMTSILNEKDVLAKKDDVNSAPMGTGPFKFESWEEKDKIVLAANEEYFLGAPKVKKLIFKNIPEASSKLVALETGEVDIATGISPVDNKTIEKNSKLKLISLPSSGTEYIFVNNKKPNLAIKEVRQAINLALDRKGMVDSVYLGAAEPSTGFMNPKVFASYSDNLKFQQNIEKAKSLLKSVGKDKGLKLKLWVNDNNPRIQSAQIIQSNLKNIGIDVDIEVLEWATYLQRSANGEHDLLLGGWISGTLDADIVMYPLFHSDSLGGAGNRAFYSNKKIDNLIENGRAEINVEKRKSIYKEIQIILNEELPIIPLYYVNQNIGLNKKVENFEYNPSTMYFLYGLDKE